MSRWKAAALHLFVSFLVVGAITTTMYLLWFPYGLIRIAGMDKLIVTMLCVDIGAGPLLTLVAFKAHDMAHTRRDLVVIALLQAAFMGYALHTAWISRPVFLVWSVDQAYLMYANEIEPKQLARAERPDAGDLSWTGPRLFSVRMPKDPDARSKVFEDVIRAQTSLERMPRHFASYEVERARILRASTPLDAPPARVDASALAQAVAETGQPASALRLVPLTSSRLASYLLIDGKSAMPLRALKPRTEPAKASATPSKP